MRVEEIRSILSENPHQPAELHLTSGRSVRARGLDYVFFPPASQTIIVAVSEGGYAIIDCLTISEVRVSPRRKSKA